MTQENPKVVVTKEFEVAPDTVFDAWLDPNMVGRWMFGPDVRDEEITSLETNPREGGSFSFVVLRDGEELDHMGRYLEIDRPNRLVFTWGVNEESDNSVVTVNIEATNAGCWLTLIHELDPSWTDYVKRTKKGWTKMLGHLKQITDNKKEE